VAVHTQRPGIDPLQERKFRIEIEGRDLVGFSEFSNPEEDSDVTEYREGDWEDFVRKQAGMRKFNEITLSKGVMKDSLFMREWIKTKERLTVDIVRLDHNRQEATRYRLEEAFPKKYTPGKGDAMSGDGAAIESMDLAFDEGNWIVD